MNRPLHQLLARLVPSAAVGQHQVTLSVRTSEGSRDVELLGCGQHLVQVLHPHADAGTVTRGHLVIAIDDDALRVDVPIVIASRSRSSMLLRIDGAPLVMRRRIVRDRALAEALGHVA